MMTVTLVVVGVLTASSLATEANPNTANTIETLAAGVGSFLFDSDTKSYVICH